MSTMNVLDLPYREASLWLWMREVGGFFAKSEIMLATGLRRDAVQCAIRNLEASGLVEIKGKTRNRAYRAIRPENTTDQPQRTRSRSRRRKTPRNAPAQAPTQAPTEAPETAATPPQVPLPPPPPPAVSTEPEVETEEQKAEKDRKIKELFAQLRRQFEPTQTKKQHVYPPLPPEIGPKHPEAATRRPLLYPVDGGAR